MTSCRSFNFTSILIYNKVLGLKNHKSAESVFYVTGEKKGKPTVRICWEGKCSGKTSPTPFSMDQHLSFDKKNSVIPRAELHTST